MRLVFCLQGPWPEFSYLNLVCIDDWDCREELCGAHISNPRGGVSASMSRCYLGWPILLASWMHCSSSHPQTFATASSSHSSPRHPDTRIYHPWTSRYYSPSYNSGPTRRVQRLREAPADVVLCRSVFDFSSIFSSLCSMGQDYGNR